MMAGFSKLVVH